MHWNGGLVEARHNHKHQVFSRQHTCATVFFLKMWYDSVAFWRIFGFKYCPEPENIYKTIFHLVANKPICIGYLSVWQTLQHVQGLLSELYFERMGSKIEKHKVFNRVLQHRIFLNKWIWIIRCFLTHCELPKFTIQDMPFKTKLTALVNGRGLTDSASLKIIKIMAATLGAITDLKLFWAVYMS